MTEVLLRGDHAFTITRWRGYEMNWAHHFLDMRNTLFGRKWFDCFDNSILEVTKLWDFERRISKMAQHKQSATDFIQSTFSPQVAVLTSNDAELLCQKNNLSFVQLVQPFCTLKTEGEPQYIYNWSRMYFKPSKLSPIQ